MRRGTYWEWGRPRTLVLLTDLTRTLHAEERQLANRLLRTLRHEVHNSLAPIRSIAGTLRTYAAADQPPDDWRDDLRDGLAVIESRCDTLLRFTRSFSGMDGFPSPAFRDVAVGPLVERVASTETRWHVGIVHGPDIVIPADPDQLEQLLLNLIRNAVDAVADRDGAVETGWELRSEEMRLWVDDTGPGLPEGEDCFLPFFTTKPDGVGIGLTLSRQIAEAHGGTLELGPRPDGVGCRALLVLPASHPQ